MGNDLEMARRIAEEVRQAGGRAYFVGGYVRDYVLGRENKDIDIEVHGIPAAKLSEILDSLGEKTVMGASFGVYGLRHYDLDIAMPRSESATGRGHKDFEIFVDPFIGEEKAACRRDFTINALMMDVLTGEVLDFFGGLDDLKRGRIRHVSDKTFVEDPLRVLRGAQFAARFEFTVAEETAALCRKMDLSALSCERIMGELEKALLKAEKPSLFFECLREMNALDVWFPELVPLIDAPQNRQTHPEGSVWVHTMQVLDEAARFRDRTQKPLWFMLAALCHDLGKPRTVKVDEKDGSVHSYGHELAGVPIAEKLISRLTTEVNLSRYVLNMVRLHMNPRRKLSAGAAQSVFMEIFDESVNPKELLYLCEADRMSRQTPDNPREKIAMEYRDVRERLLEQYQAYVELMAKPCVMGRDLMRAGIPPCEAYKDALAFAHKLHLSGVPKEEALKQTLKRICPE